MSQKEAHTNEALDLSDEKYEKPAVVPHGDSVAKSNGGDGGGGGLPFAITVENVGKDDSFEDLEMTPNAFMDAIERAQVRHFNTSRSRFTTKLDSCAS